jgi:hypothetical protein
MRIWLRVAAFSLMLAGLVIAGGPASAKCGDLSRLSGPGLGSHGVRLPCTTTALGKNIPQERGVSALQRVPAHHGPRYTITYPFTTRAGSPRRWVIYLYPYSIGGPVIHVSAGQNVFNLFVTNAMTFRVEGSTARAFRVLHFPGRAARLVPPAPERAPTTVAQGSGPADPAGGEGRWVLWTALGMAVAALVGIAGLGVARRRRTAPATP